MISGAVTCAGTAVLDNSGVFKDHLRESGMNEGLRQHQLRLRHINRVVPHVCPSVHQTVCGTLILYTQRLCAPLGAPPDALPQFKTDEDWYLYVR
jgi:hypothetical protein